MLLTFTSYIAGVLTVLAPCVLPLLPIIIGNAASSDSRKSAFRLIGALTVSIIAFTLLLRASTLLISIPNSAWSTLSGVILLVFGAITLFPQLWEKLSLQLNLASKHGLEKANEQQGWKRDIGVGIALGPVFTSCSPTYSLILATVLPISFAEGVFYIVVYALGLASILLLIALLGRRLTKNLRTAADPNGWFKKSLGIIFILVGIFIITGWDKDIEAYIIDQGYFGITEFEEGLVEQIQKS